MNFVLSSYFVERISKNQVLFNLFLTVLLSVYLVGCSDQVRLPSREQLAEFESAGPIRPTVDVDRLVRARIERGLYRVIPGDVLELTMPTVLQVVMAERLEVFERVSPFTPYMCRVSESGTITLPIVGKINVSGKSLAEVESAVIGVYHPKYVGTRPSVLARVAEYRTAKVSITGAVVNLGVYELNSDEMSLVALLMKAGGIIDEGAALIRITHQEEAVADKADAPRETLDETLQLVTPQPRKKAIEQLSDTKETVAPVPPADNPGTKQVKVQLAFSQLSPAETIRYNSENQTTNVNTNSIAKINISDSKQNPFSDETLEKDILKILDLEKSLGIRKAANLSKVIKPQSLILPVKGLNIPFADIALQEGDSVEVERLELPLVTVMGLVNKPGNFPYPPDVRYNLMQTLAFAGGLYQAAEPRYVTVYRLKANGTIVSAIFKVVDSSKLANASNVLIKPGDIVAVEHTPRTRSNLFLDRVFRINVGAFVPIISR